MVSRSAAVEEYFQPKRRRAGGLPARHRHRRRAVPARLRRDEDEAAAGAGDPRERARRAHPRALARGPRLDARVDERREEPLGGRVAALAAVGPVLGAARARAHAPEEAAGVRHARRDRPGDGPRARRRSTRSAATTASRTGSTRSSRSPGPQPGGETRKVPMPQTAPGRYEADFPLDRYGSFLLHASLEKPIDDGHGNVKSATRRRELRARDEPVSARVPRPRPRRGDARARGRGHGRARSIPTPAAVFDPAGEVDPLPRGPLAALRRRRPSRSSCSTCSCGACACSTGRRPREPRCSAGRASLAARR